MIIIIIIIIINIFKFLLTRRFDVNPTWSLQATPNYQPLQTTSHMTIIPVSCDHYAYLEVLVPNTLL